jgi:hypothetical protein
MSKSYYFATNLIGASSDGSRVDRVSQMTCQAGPAVAGSRNASIVGVGIIVVSHVEVHNRLGVVLVKRNSTLVELLSTQTEMICRIVKIFKCHICVLIATWIQLRILDDIF